MTATLSKKQIQRLEAKNLYVGLATPIPRYSPGWHMMRKKRVGRGHGPGSDKLWPHNERSHLHKNVLERPITRGRIRGFHPRKQDLQRKVRGQQLAGQFARQLAGEAGAKLQTVGR